LKRQRPRKLNGLLKQIRNSKNIEVKMRKKLNYIIITAILTISLLIVVGCSSAEDAKAYIGSTADTVKIGVYQPLSGKDMDNAKPEIIGIELAHKLYPRVLGKKVELVYANNKSNILHGRLAAQKLVNSEVEIILGSYGNIMSMTGGQYFQEAGIPAISITCTNPLVTKGNPCYFRIGTIDSFQAIMAAKYVYNELKPEKVAILRETGDDYGTALAQQFSDKLISLAETEEAEPIKIFPEEYKKNETDYERHLRQIKNSGAQVIYLPCSWEEAVEIIKQAKEISMDFLFIGTDIWHEKGFIEEGGEDVEGVIFTDYFDGETSIGQKTQEFLSAYKREYGDDIPSNGTALGFDAYLLALHAIEKRTESESLCDVLAGVRDFVGATGSISFDEDGDPIKPVVLTTIEKGEFKHKYTAEPEWN
jgi:branched-chain amino acid transport system substrate-binding protein